MIMDDYKVLGEIWFWALMALITALHVCSGLVRGRKVGIITVAANVCAHISLLFAMFMRRADVSELFLALLISLSAALLCRSVTIKTGKSDPGKGE